MRKLIMLSAGFVSCFAPLVSAEPYHVPSHCPRPAADFFLPEDALTAESDVDVQADTAQLVDLGTSVFTGKVDVRRGGQQLNANRATYNQTTGKVTAQGDVRLRDSQMSIFGDQAEWNLDEDRGTLIDAKYQMKQMNARGEASHVNRQGVQSTQLKNATYTTCMENDDFWKLKAGEVDLDHEEGVGRAYDVVLRMMDVPVFYTPYISFPLSDERKSGFLIPSIGNSNETGFDVSTPYYWNIAPDMDATLTPRYMSDRGLMLIGEYRYLTSQSEGIIDAGFLGSDSLRQNGDEINPNYNQNRKHFSFQQDGRYANRWRTQVDYNYVSDRDYLEDFSNNLSLSSTTHLNRLLNVNYYGDIWNFGARVQGYQTLLREVEEPYQRLPQLTLRGLLPDQAYGLSYEFNSEFTAFDHDELVKGQRLNIEPGVSLPMGTAGFFVTPRVALKQSYYSLDNLSGQSQFEESSINRTLPVVSLDSGLVFERPLNFAGNKMIQTLEPRAFYLYIPYRDQDDIPLFDTNLRTFGMGSMFSHERFTGPDRIGDANQVTVGLTSRFIDEEAGREKLSVTLGQIQYFSDRRVNLRPDVRETSSDSDYIAEAIASISEEWALAGQIQWDPDTTQSSMSSLQLRYRNEDGGVFNIAHRYRRDDGDNQFPLDQIDVSGSVPINDQWSVIGRYYRSLRDSLTLETLAGVEYHSCCWATRIVYRDYVKDTNFIGIDNDEFGNENRTKAIFFEIELKGLGRFGKKSDGLLEDSIRGYE
ncbi:LPS assembly protein LptD [Methylophaga sp.]|uniref:LPS-assembly protein LptD n=1 Tax=Methylophaga sp. TaxID=2024840 RepID=UPI000C8966F0|nr:LPS assembly protein LptD [Methylophaga sp.]MAY18771.1 organic solvent tolerance protein [Methylophaga sp.]